MLACNSGLKCVCHREKPNTCVHFSVLNRIEVSSKNNLTLCQALSFSYNVFYVAL